MVIGFLGVFTVTHLMLRRIGLSPIVHGLIILSMPYAFIIVMLYTVMPVWHRACRESKLNMVVCPSCDYDLASALRDMEGRLVCSECGSVWTLSSQDR